MRRSRIRLGLIAIVGILGTAEYGGAMYTEKLLDTVFTNGTLTRVANQFGKGLHAAN